MASTHTISIELSDDLYTRLQNAAQQSERPLERVLVESLALLYGTPTTDQEAQQEIMDTYSDAQLWAIVYQRLTSPERERLHVLQTKQQAGGLSAEETPEFDALVEVVDQQMLLRSKALFLLQERGYHINVYLQAPLE